MFRFKIFFSIIIFSFFLIGTSIIKNQTREIEKKIVKLSKIVHLKEKDYYESQLDFFYLTSPKVVEKKINDLNYEKYLPMKYSNIFLSMSNFIDLKNKLAIQKN